MVLSRVQVGVGVGSTTIGRAGAGVGLGAQLVACGHAVAGSGAVVGVVTATGAAIASLVVTASMHPSPQAAKPLIAKTAKSREIVFTIHSK